MKKLFLILALSLSIVTISAQDFREKGTQLTLNGAWNPIHGGFGLTVSYSWQFNQHFSLGVATGLCGFASMVIPIMADARWYMMNDKNTPYLGLRVGPCIGVDTSKNSPGWLAIPELGFAFGRFTVGLWYANHAYYRPDDNNNKINELASGLQLGLGWTF